MIRPLSRSVFLFAFFVVYLVSNPCALAQSLAGRSLESVIEHVMRAQQQAWNRHDLEGFMAGYWNSPELTFFSGGTESKGWQAAMDRYRAKYSGPGKEMGTLEFSNLRVQMLGSDAAFARGSWRLTMTDGKTPHGLFTLVFRKFPEGWEIVHDHTSVE